MVDVVTDLLLDGADDTDVPLGFLPSWLEALI